MPDADFFTSVLAFAVTLTSAISAIENILLNMVYFL
jgi:hypothetical protein